MEWNAPIKPFNAPEILGDNKNPPANLIEISLEGFEEKSASSRKSYIAKICLQNKNDSNILYKIRLSSFCRPNVMVKPNMGLLLPGSNVIVKFTFLEDNKTQVQIATAIYPDDIRYVLQYVWC